MEDDGVNREGLDYRAGYIEALQELKGVLAIMSVRPPKKVGDAIGKVDEWLMEKRKAMIAKMKGR